jgi:hypothetical protein
MDGGEVLVASGGEDKGGVFEVGDGTWGVGDLARA